MASFAIFHIPLIIRLQTISKGPPPPVGITFSGSNATGQLLPMSNPIFISGIYSYYTYLYTTTIQDSAETLNMI